MPVLSFFYLDKTCAFFQLFFEEQYKLKISMVVLWSYILHRYTYSNPTIEISITIPSTHFKMVESFLIEKKVARVSSQKCTHMNVF